MKKSIFLILGCFFGLFFTELFFRYVIKFPTYNIAYKVYGISKVLKQSNIFQPHAKYWNVEAGDKVFSRNNLGLPGIDVDITIGSKFIYVLGNSYVESLQVNQPDNPVSIFQSKLNNLNGSYQAINLAYSGQDPYSLYFRSRYFEAFYPPSYVILLVNWDYPILHNDVLDFKKPINFGVRDNKLLSQLMIKIRNHSSFIELIAKCLHKFSDNINEDNLKVVSDVKADHESIKIKDYSSIKLCIDKFSETYKGKFICVYFGPNDDLEKELSIHCCNSKVPYFSKDIGSMQGVNKVGHFNQIGCKYLGDLIYEAFCKYFK